MFVIVDPAFRPETRHIAMALSEASLPFTLFTSAYPTRQWLATSGVGPAALRRRMLAVILRRFEPGIDDRLVVNLYFPDLIRLLGSLGRIPAFRTNMTLEPLFDRFVSLTAARRGKTVVAIQGAALSTFMAARARGGTCVLIAQTPDPMVEDQIVQAEEVRLGIRLRSHRVRKAYAERIRREYASADLILANSAFTRTDIVANGVAARKVVEVPLGVDLSKFRPKHYGPVTETSRRSGAQVLFVGIVQARKGVTYLARAVQDLRREGVEVTARAVGILDRDYVEALKPAVDSGALQLVGAVPQHLLHQEYCDADVFVFPTLSDGFGLVVLEAMACGLPVIVSDRCGAPVEAEVNAIVVPHSDHKLLASALKRVLGDEELRDRLRDAGLNTAREMSWDVYRSKVRSVLVNVR